MFLQGGLHEEISQRCKLLWRPGATPPETSVIPQITKVAGSNPDSISMETKCESSQPANVTQHDSRRIVEVGFIPITFCFLARTRFSCTMPSFLGHQLAPSVGPAGSEHSVTQWECFFFFFYL